MIAMKKGIFLLVLAVLGAACSNPGSTGNSGSQCGTKEACLSDPNCQCWCSQKCGFRKKEASDRSVYIADDPYGKYCYCNQWDYDNYKNNCIDGMGIPEPGK